MNDNPMSCRKVAVMALNDVTFITRFHRNVQTVREMGFNVKCFSVRPRKLHGANLYEGIVIDGWTRRLRGRLFAPLRQFEITLRFFLAVWRYRPDVLYAHNLPTLAVAWAVRVLRGRQKTVLIYDAMELESRRVGTIRSFIPFLPRDYQRIKMERFLVRRADLVTSADHARTEAMKKLLDWDDILTCRNVPFFRKIPRTRILYERLGLAEDVFVFLYQGILTQGRGLEQAIRSLKKLPEKIVFAVVGAGTDAYLNSLRTLAEAEGVGRRVFILPPVPSDQLLNWTASADAIHSLIENVCLSYYLAAPNKFYEAAMAGVPVIASRFPEMEAVLKRHPYGILVDPNSIEEIAAAILCLYEDTDLRRRFQEAGLRAAESELNWEQESRPLQKRIKDATARLL
jgi:glycosyltransferase involved in cell wall biosynthesis